LTSTWPTRNRFRLFPFETLRLFLLFLPSLTLRQKVPRETMANLFGSPLSRPPSRPPSHPWCFGRSRLFFSKWFFLLVPTPPRSASGDCHGEFSKARGSLPCETFPVFSPFLKTLAWDTFLAREFIFLQLFRFGSARHGGPTSIAQVGACTSIRRMRSVLFS